MAQQYIHDTVLEIIYTCTIIIIRSNIQCNQISLLLTTITFSTSQMTSIFSPALSSHLILILAYAIALLPSQQQKNLIRENNLYDDLYHIHMNIRF